MKEKVLTDFSKNSLLTAGLGNRSEFLKTLLNSDRREYQYGSDLKWIYSGFENILMFDFHTELDTVSETIDALKENYEGSIGAVCCLLHQYSQPGDLKTFLLKEKDFVHADDLFGMWLDLSNRDFDFKPQPGFTIERIHHPAGLKAWSEVVCQGFDLTRFLESFHKAMIRSFDKYHHYIGYRNGEPVAALSMLLAKGVAGIYWVTTVERARNRGFASNMLNKALMVARQLGYQVSVLQSSRMAHEWYKKTGYVDCFTEHSIEWYPEQ